ncbi:hypothetical protein Afil01_23140 [Actinorhabdospora filicis]|uniref:Uncharacterized protein n=1 Tax=Actinorhabdospora filicis TaxID=1785913 RepID=A0A9W6SKJ0_9ACTN|nr:hypothetical protein [Actinorhabdospora filicis]GLZ77507.1 hypothetical protein Afil01_23140 [Actinorhabdospora filicis]
MVVQTAMVARFLVLLLAVGVNSRVEPLPALVILLLVAGAMVVVPTLRWLVHRLLRVAAAPAHGPPRVARTGSPGVRTPSDPGIPGAVRARAPSPGGHAFA